MLCGKAQLVHDLWFDEQPIDMVLFVPAIFILPMRGTPGGTSAGKLPVYLTTQGQEYGRIHVQWRLGRRSEIK